MNNLVKTKNVSKVDSRKINISNTNFFYQYLELIKREDNLPFFVAEWRI